MTLIGVLNQEFLQHNANRSYPLSEQATKQPIQGAADFTIPNNFLVAAKIVISTAPDIVNVSGFYISRITVYNGGVSILISYENTVVGSVTAANRNTFNTSFPITGLNSFHGLAGHVTIGTFEQINTCLGDYSFDLSGGRLDADVISYAPAAVTSLTIVKNGIVQEPIYGDIRFVAGENIEIEEAVDSETGNTTVTISRKDDELVEKSRYIRSFNGGLVVPDETGNIDFESLTTCLQITEGKSSISINENCSEPCCGCEELASLTASITSIIQSNNEIRLFQQKLEQHLLSLTTTLNITGV